MFLEQAGVGDAVEITAVPNPEIAVIALRLGIYHGERVTVASKIPGGPLIVRRGNVEIALGREICRRIEVRKTQ